MILHIGNGKTVQQRDIIGIFDMDNTTVTAAGREYLSRAQREGRVSYADYDIPRSFITEGAIIRAPTPFGPCILCEETVIISAPSERIVKGSFI